jgi:D-psicose/D-tagatose/L-ribulose 3-epimerase
MRYGICTGLENLETVKNAGYDYIEPSVTGVMKLTPEETEKYALKLKEMRIGAEVFNVLFPKTMALLGPEADEKALRSYLAEAFARISSLGAKTVVFGSGKSRSCPEGYEYGKAYRELKKVYRATGEEASRFGITVVIEPLSRKETNMICTMAEGAILMEDVGNENVKLLSDYFHVIANNDDIGIMKTIRHFSHIHIASGNGRRYPLSAENEKYAEFMKALKEIGYDGRMSIEGKTDNMAEDAPKALSFLKKTEAEANG